MTTMRVLEFSPGALIKTAIALPTKFLGANVGLAANLPPNLHIWLEGQIAQRAVPCSRRPEGDFFQLVLLRPGEEIVLLLARTQQPARTNIILPAFDQTPHRKSRAELFVESECLCREVAPED